MFLQNNKVTDNRAPLLTSNDCGYSFEYQRK